MFHLYIRLAEKNSFKNILEIFGGEALDRVRGRFVGQHHHTAYRGLEDYIKTLDNYAVKYIGTFQYVFRITSPFCLSGTIPTGGCQAEKAQINIELNRLNSIFNILVAENEELSAVKATNNDLHRIATMASDTNSRTPLTHSLADLLISKVTVSSPSSAPTGRECP